MKQARTTPQTARKPDALQGRSRGNTSRVSVASVTGVGASRENVRAVDTPKPKKSVAVERSQDKDVVERSRDSAGSGGAVDSIAARLDQWETQEEKRRLEQTTEGKIPFFDKIICEETTFDSFIFS